MARVIGTRSVGALALLAAIAGGAAPQASPTHAATTVDSVAISMGYIPNVQFAPFYVAVARGYYAAAHIHVSFDYSTAPDIITLVASGNRSFGNTEGDQVVVGRSRGLPVVSVLTQYQRFPVVIFALKSSAIRSFADLKGKTIGIPGLYGASYTGLLAALSAAHLSTHDVKIVAINYTQVSQVAQHQVDAAVGYAMNEPVQLQSLGYQVLVLPLTKVVNLVGAGVVTSQAMISQKPDLVQRFVHATYLGLRDTIADPAGTFAVARGFIKGLSSSQFKLQLAELRAAIGYWTPAAGAGLGCGSPTQWANTVSALRTQKQISTAPSVSALFTNRFLPKC